MISKSTMYLTVLAVPLYQPLQLCLQVLSRFYSQSTLRFHNNKPCCDDKQPLCMDHLPEMCLKCKIGTSSNAK